MKKFFLILMAIGVLAIVACEDNEEVTDTIEVYSPDKDEVKPPGGRD